MFEYAWRAPLRALPALVCVLLLALAATAGTASARIDGTGTVVRPNTVPATTVVQCKSDAWHYIANDYNGYVIGNCAPGANMQVGWKNFPSTDKHFYAGAIGGNFGYCGWMDADNVGPETGTTSTLGSCNTEAATQTPLTSFMLVANCRPGQCTGGAPTSVPLNRSCPYYANVKPWLNSSGALYDQAPSLPAGTPVGWRYITLYSRNDGTYGSQQFVMVHVLTNVSPAPQWGFVPRDCLPETLPATDSSGNPTDYYCPSLPSPSICTNAQVGGLLDQTTGNSPVALRNDSTNDQYVYFPKADRRLYGLAYSSSGWTYAPVTGSSVSPGTKPAAILDAPSGTQWLYYNGNNANGTGNTIRESWWTASSGWNDITLSANARPRTSPSVLRDAGSTNQWVFYHGSDDAVWVLGWTPGSGWVNNRLGGGIASGSSPAAVRSTSTGEQWAYYAGTDGNLWCWYFSGSSWTNVQITSGGTMAAGRIPSVIRDASSGNQWIYYPGADNAVWVAGWTAASGWSNSRLGGAVAANGSPSAVLDPSSHFQWVYYPASDGKVHVYTYNVSSWTDSSLGGTSVAASPAVSAVRDPGSGQQWVYYPSANGQGGTGNIWNWAFTGSAWVNNDMGH